MPAAGSRRGSRQQELIPRSRTPVIAIDAHHRLVELTEILDWTELEELVESIRRRRLKSSAGRPPHLRALTGVLVFRALRKMTYRDTEDQVRHYAPARYLCGLTETDWTPDANTIQDFEQLLGEHGVGRLNEYVVKVAVKEKLADPNVVAADMTAQEAAIPHPNEMGLMATFLTGVMAASKKVGGALKTFAAGAAQLVKAAKRKLREYRLFAKDKAKAVKDRMVAATANLIGKVQVKLSKALDAASRQKQRLVGYGKVAWTKVESMHETMKRLLPQIRHWLKTGRVAAGKIINLQIPELYSIVRGKVGKAVEFGLSWGVTRLKGGFLLVKQAEGRSKLTDSVYAVEAVEEHIGRFGRAPRAYAYDRGGYSQENVEKLRRLGVREVGLYPRGRARWLVDGRTKRKLISERAQVEGGIGSIKTGKYGFNRPAARSVDTMGVCGQRAALGYNLNKLIRGLAERDGVELVG